MRALWPTRSATLAVALVAVWLTTGCSVLSGDQLRVTAVFTDSIGLYVGNDVSVLGIPVGEVTAIRPEGTRVIVELAVDRDTPIPADVGAVTVSPSVVTDRRVELTPVYRGGARLRDGDRIPMERTRTPVEIDRVFAAADRLAGELNKVMDSGGRSALADALDVSSREFAGNGAKLREATRALAGMVGVGADNRDQLVALIRHVDQLTRVAADNDATIRSFSANLTDAVALADQQGPNLVDALEDLTDLLARADQLITDNRDEGERTLSSLRLTARTLQGRTRELAESADVLPTAFRNLAGIVDPELRRARVHVSLEQPTLDTQLLAGICRDRMPALCAPGPDGRMNTQAGLAALLLGGPR
ncbi:MAG: MCE family protein [Pseudonocardia sp.]